MKNPIVEIVRKEMARFQAFRTNNPTLFPNQDNLYPIPFFGDIRKAEVLTLALNPAWPEFRRGGNHERNWVPGLDSYALTTRLLHYFDLPTPAPHRWFEERRAALDLLNCSYETNVAHIDLHPFPTKFRNALGETQRKQIGDWVESESGSHLMQVLRVAPKAKLILVVDYTFSQPDGTAIQTFGFVESQHCGLSELVSEHGSRPPIFRAGGPTHFEARIRQRADILNDCLNNSQPLRLCPFAPLR